MYNVAYKSSRLRHEEKDGRLAFCEIDAEIYGLVKIADILITYC